MQICKYIECDKSWVPEIWSGCLQFGPWCAITPDEWSGPGSTVEYNADEPQCAWPSNGTLDGEQAEWHLDYHIVVKLAAPSEVQAHPNNVWVHTASCTVVTTLASVEEINHRLFLTIRSNKPWAKKMGITRGRLLLILSSILIWVGVSNQGSLIPIRVLNTKLTGNLNTSGDSLYCQPMTVLQIYT